MSKGGTWIPIPPGNPIHRNPQAPHFFFAKTLRGAWGETEASPRRSITNLVMLISEGSFVTAVRARYWKSFSQSPSAGTANVSQNKKSNKFDPADFRRIFCHGSASPVLKVLLPKSASWNSQSVSEQKVAHQKKITGAFWLESSHVSYISFFHFSFSRFDFIKRWLHWEYIWPCWLS